MTPFQIKRLRRRLKVTQEALATILGTSFVTVSRWENGHHAPVPAYAEALANLNEIAKSERRVRALKRRHGL